jgi:hypothetical protein
MKLYRVSAKTSQTGGMYFDAVSSLQTAVRNATDLQAQNPNYKVSVEEETWPTLGKFAYWRYVLTGAAEGFGTAFSKSTGHRVKGTVQVWPKK